MSQVRRKMGLTAPKRKGMGVRIGDRDFAAMEAAAFHDPGSYIRKDGSEKLAGEDWRKRRVELVERSGGKCERWNILRKPHDAFCDGLGGEPHHIVKRSVRRNDALGNLVDLSHACHKAEDPRKIRSGGDNHGKNSA